MSDIDDIHDRIKELKKDMSDMASFFGKAMSDAERASNKIADTAKKRINITNLLQATINSSKDLRNNFDSVSDLQEAIAKDAKLFKTVQQQINSQMADAFQQMDAKLQAQLELIDNDEERNRLLEKNQMTQMQISNDVAAQVAIVEKQVKQNNKNLLALENMKNVVDDLGDKIRNPAMIADQLIYKFGEVSTKLFEARQEGKSFSKILGDGLKSSLKNIVSVASSLFSSAGIFIVGFGLVAGVAAGVFNLFTSFWKDLDENVIPAIADLNKKIGGLGNTTSKLKGQALGVGREFQSLGMSFSEGAALVGDFASGINSINLDRKTLQTAKEMIAVVGIGAQDAGDFANQFLKQEGSLKGLNEAFAVGASEAKAWGVPVNDVLRDMAESPDILARFGTANRKEFAIASAKARSYGLTIKEVNGVFGKTLDTFEGSSKVASNLNSIFGTTINSFELMLETDPTKRLEMLRGELVKQGKSWDNLNNSEKNVITSTLGIDEKQAALVLSSDKVRKKLEAQEKKAKSLAKVEEKWNAGMGSIKRSLIEWQVELDKVGRAALQFVAKLLGFESAESSMQDLATAGKQFLGELEKGIKNATKEIEPFKKNLMEIKNILDKISTFGHVLTASPEELQKEIEHATSLDKKAEQWASDQQVLNAKNRKRMAENFNMMEIQTPESNFSVSGDDGNQNKTGNQMNFQESEIEPQPVKTTKIKTNINPEVEKLKKQNAELIQKNEKESKKKYTQMIEGQLELVSGGEKLGKFILKNAIQKSRS